MKRAIKWTLWNLGIAACIYGAILNEQWAKNILWFWLIVSALLLPMSAIIPEVREKARKKGRSVPAFIEGITSLAFIIALVGFVHPVLGALAFWEYIWTSAIYNPEFNPKTAK